MMVDYSERARALEELAAEVERLERQSSADDVGLRMTETVDAEGELRASVTFEYVFEVNDGDDL